MMRAPILRTALAAALALSAAWQALGQGRAPVSGSAPSTGGSGGAVSSVNGKTGAVTLSHADITDFTAAVVTAAPVQSVAGQTGAPTAAQLKAALAITPADVSGLSGLATANPGAGCTLTGGVLACPGTYTEPAATSSTQGGVTAPACAPGQFYVTVASGALVCSGSFAANGTDTSLSLAQQTSRVIDLKGAGAKGDGLSFTDATIAAGSSTLMTSAAHFLPSDVGKFIATIGTGSGGATQTGTIQAYVSSTQVTLSYSAVNAAPTNGIISLTISTPGTDYGAGDFIYPTVPGAVTPAQFQILDSQVFQADFEAGNAGTGATTSGACTVMGTTGTLRSKKNVGYPIIQVQVSGGSITAVNSIITGGDFTADPNREPTLEPVVPAQNSSGALRSDACLGLTGAKLGFRTNAYPIHPMVPVVYGAYTGTLHVNTPTYATTTTNSAGNASAGAGMVITLSGTRQGAGQYTYGTDDSTAIAKAIGWVNATEALGVHTALFASAGACSASLASGVQCSTIDSTGAYIIGPATALPCFTGGGITGADRSRTLFYQAGPSQSDPAFCWSGATNRGSNTVFDPTTSSFSAGHFGPSASNFSLIGDRTGGNHSGLQVYDTSDNANFHDIDAYEVEGPVLRLGCAVKTLTFAYTNEAQFDDIRAYNSGSLTTPELEVCAMGTGGKTSSVDDLRFNRIELFSPQSSGLVIHAQTNSQIGFVHINFLRVEGLAGYSNGGAGDLVEIGDTATGWDGVVHDVTISNYQLVDPEPGYDAFHVALVGGDAVNLSPYNIILANGDVAGGAPYGNGIAVDACRYCQIHIMSSAAYGTDLSVGASSLINALEVDTPADTSGWALSIDPTETGLIQQKAVVLGGIGTSGSNVALSATAVGVSVAPLTAGVVPAANLPLSTAPTVFGSATASEPLLVEGPAGSIRGMKWLTGNSVRWYAYANATAESGSNAGSDWTLNGYSDTGTLLGAWLTMTRATGAATFAGTVKGNLVIGTSGVQVGSIPSAPYLATDSSGNIITAATPAAVGPASSSYVGTNGAGQMAAAATPVTTFNTRSGAVTLSSSDVTTALTYTPYNTSNPSSYITAAQAPVTSVDTLTGGVVTEHCDTFTTLGNNTWTKLSWSTFVTVELVGGGGGGGKGGTDPGSSITSGGAGGGASNHIRFSGPASAFSTGTVFVATGGAASTGAGAGAAGGGTQFASKIATGGGGGADGASGGVAAGSGSAGGLYTSGVSGSGATGGVNASGGEAGGTSNSTALFTVGQGTAGGGAPATGLTGGNAGPTNDAPTGGGAGGGLTGAATPVAAAGGYGGAANSGNVATGGANTGGAGSAGVVTTGLIGQGGGGGGANPSGTGGAGGAGVNGGGGGGGGAGTSAGGAGGAGGNGWALICQRATG